MVIEAPDARDAASNALASCKLSHDSLYMAFTLYCLANNLGPFCFVLLSVVLLQ